jgi:dihydrofolate synthase/folylpolyglutamate synthase
MTYEEALTYIHSTPNFARGASLGRITALLRELGNPQEKVKFVHIAGTNGKGSTAAMLASILQAAGYRTGLYTSPYLEKFNERMRLNGASIGDDALAQLTGPLKAAVERLEAQGMESPNEFERVTALALCWYAQAGAEIVVLEVGLGGRYDATNVIAPPEACAITSISLDHTAVLGNTVEEIAQEKGGILKAGTPCVLSSDQPEGVRQVIRTIAGEVGAPLVESGQEQISVTRRDLTGLTFTWLGRSLHLPLLGEYQAHNVCTVLNLVECLRLRGWDIPLSAVAEGLEQVVWPGRLELMGNRYLLDCGHNPGGISALCGELDTTFAGRPIVTVMGMLRDKAYEGCLKAVARRSGAFFAVSPPSPRALPVEDIGTVAATCCSKVTSCTSIHQALQLAEAEAGAQGLVVVCGSIPLVGEARGFLTAPTPTANPHN